jgi:hypothetical protein
MEMGDQILRLGPLDSKVEVKDEKADPDLEPAPLDLSRRRQKLTPAYPWQSRRVRCSARQIDAILHFIVVRHRLVHSRNEAAVPTCVRVFAPFPKPATLLKSRAA